MQAIIPLAGKGTRVRPHTHSRPKPLLRVANRPVLDYVLDTLIEAGVDEVIFITGHLAGQIETHMASDYPDLTKHYIEQVEQNGTADAIRLARPHVTGPVLIVFVDTIFAADMGIIAQRPEDDGIIWAKEVEDYSRFGVIVTDENGYMERIVEKPDTPISRLANIGVYYIKNQELMFEGIDHVMAQDPQMGEYFLTDAFQYMIDNGARLYTAEVEGWWDCGKPETILETNREMLRRLGDSTSGERPAGGRYTEPVLIAQGVTVEDAEIGPDVSVAENTEIIRSRLRDCVIGEDTRIEDSDLEGAFIGDRAIVIGVRGHANVGDDAHVNAMSRARAE